MNLEELDKDELERVKLMVDISKIQADIEATRQSIEATRQSIDESHARIEQMRLSNDKYLAETARIRKETEWFPYIQIITTILTGGVVVYLLTKLLA